MYRIIINNFTKMSILWGIDWKWSNGCPCHTTQYLTFCTICTIDQMNFGYSAAIKLARVHCVHVCEQFWQPLLNNLSITIIIKNCFTNYNHTRNVEILKKTAKMQNEKCFNYVEKVFLIRILTCVCDSISFMMKLS